MKTCVISISKNAQDINDWIDYYFSLGFNHIFLFDNNNFNERYNISDERITIIPYPSEFPIQKDCKSDEWRQSFLLKIGIMFAFDQDYDYCFICDDDEYIDFKGNFNNINELIEKYKDYDSIEMSWEIFGDNEYVYIDDEPKGKSICEIYSKSEEDYFETKSLYKIPKDYQELFNILRTKRNHDGYVIHKMTDDNAVLLDITEATVKHYITYSLERYLLKKGRYTGDNPWLENGYLGYFFKVNHITERKLKAYIDLCEKYNIEIPEKDKDILRKYNVEIN